MAAANTHFRRCAGLGRQSQCAAFEWCELPPNMARRSYSYIDVNADEARGSRRPRPRDGYNDSSTRRRQLIEAQSYSYIDRCEIHKLPAYISSIVAPYVATRSVAYPKHCSAWTILDELNTDREACNDCLDPLKEPICCVQCLCQSSSTSTWTSNQMS